MVIRRLPADDLVFGKIRLDVGCGSAPRPGFVGLDKEDYGQEIVWDAEQGIPLPDDSCAEIFCQHTVEHLTDLVGVMREFWRVLGPRGKLTIIAPHRTSIQALKPTHVRLIDEGTFLAFAEEDKQGAKYWRIEEMAVNERPDIHVIMSPLGK